MISERMEEFAEILKKGGSLRFWGDWFGKPYDNYHVPISVEPDGSVLTICFKNGEKCTVCEPSGIVNEPNDFHIESAKKIVWEWYYYGRECTPENFCRLENTYDRGTVFVVCMGKCGADTRSFNAKGFALE